MAGTDYDFFRAQLNKEFKRDEYIEKRQALDAEYRNEEYQRLLASLEVLRSETEAQALIPSLGLKQLVVLLLPVMKSGFLADDLIAEIAQRDPNRRVDKAALRVALKRLVQEGIIEVWSPGHSHRPTVYQLPQSAKDNERFQSEQRRRAVEAAIKAVNQQFGGIMKA